ncbi:MAG: ATP-binding protein [Bacteroidaceae bacterium]|nr:ATP-binding protein [Bacteroidaceae bacterium]
MTQTQLIEILRDQKAEIDRFATRQLCQRAEESQIRLDSAKAQVVIGVRRSGKSTLCVQALLRANVNFAYANFDDERLARLSADDLNDVLRGLYHIYGDFTHLFLDEAQNIDGWHLFVNRLLRQGMHVVITGSNAKLLSSELATHLTGRYNEIELFTFSFRDYCHLQGIATDRLTTKTDALLRKAFDQYLETGGFPEVVNGDETADEYIDKLVANILDRDIIQRFKVRYKDAFRDLSNHLMNNAPCEVVLTELKNLFRLRSDHTAENYVGYLYQAYLMMQVRKFSTKSSERIRNTKCYPIDVALMNARKDALAGQNLGWRLETLAYIELRRRHGRTCDIYYHKAGSYEVDFVVCRRSVVMELVQVSYDISGEKTFAREVNALYKAARDLHCTTLTLVTAYEESTVTNADLTISIVPAYKWLCHSADSPR